MADCRPFWKELTGRLKVLGIRDKYDISYHITNHFISKFRLSAKGLRL